MFRLNKGIWTLGIPAILSIMTVIKHSVILFALFVVILCPYLKNVKREVKSTRENMA